MFKEEMAELKFESNKGRDEFIESVLKSLDKDITAEDINEISDLLDIS